MNRLWQNIKNVYHFFQAHLWRAVYGFPDKSLTIYGVTGTNGKTTTSYILRSVLAQQYGKAATGMLTTVAFRIGEQITVNTSKMTTLPSRTLYQQLAAMKKAGVSHVVLEVTSHALDQHRLAGLTFAGAIVLNLAREHLDYHRTMEEYAAAKAKIIRYLAPGAPLVGKGDDIFVRKIVEEGKRAGLEAIAFTADEARGVRTPLEGSVNQENALAVTLLAKAVGIPAETITAGINSVTAVPGRMEWIEAPQGFRVVIDYAVTPDALQRLYSYVRSQAKGKVRGILGAAGLRDRGKRPDMAATVAKYADEIIITREDPWTENEEQIFTDLEKGLQGSAVAWQRIVDRRQALRHIISQAGPGDIVVATGKGAEAGMGIGKEVIPWNEHAIIEQLIAEKKV